MGHSAVFHWLGNSAIVALAATLGVLTLVNRPQPRAGGAPFTLDELRRAEAAAQALAAPLAWLGGLDGHADSQADGLSADLVADLMLLTEPERRVVHSLASALLQNRPDNGAE